MKFKTRQRRKA